MSDQAYVATRKGLFTIERRGGNGAPCWNVTRASFLGDNVTLVMPDFRDGWLYAALDHGHFGVKLHRSADRGESWEECAAPTYPEPPGGVSPDRCPMSGVEIPWKLKLIWALAGGGPDELGAIWCGTVPGGLFRSTDRGSTWKMMRSLWDDPGRKKWFGGGLDLPGIHSICVDPRDSRHVTVGVSCGGVWVTQDRGETWQCQAHGMRAEYLPPDQAGEPGQQDPHCLVQCPTNPDHFWVQHHNGIFRSTDGSVSWQEIENVPPSSFGFAVAVHPADPNTAWFVPAIKDERRIPVDGKLVVTRTRDGGGSFEVLRLGLPQTHAYDLVFRHALDVDQSGNRLVFGSTTGSVWVTENGGDRWDPVSTHLPPVHSVRFA
jgi:hypothetical protein